jgi:D-lactate dehydrogenase (cytochrome)
MRHNAYYAILATRPGARAIVTDICVPISRLARAIEETRTDLARAGLAGPVLGHVGDGNFHTVLMVDMDDEAEIARAKAASDRMVERALAMGGTATGEHGIGVGKLGYMAREHGHGWAMMGAIKTALDPDNILNPGKLVPPRN